MARNSLPNLRAQIAKLEQRADAIKRQVVSKLQREIKSHGLTAEDLFGGVFVGNGRKSSEVTASAKRASKRPKRASTKGVAKYGDGTGNIWGGMGKRPQWLRDRLEAGAALEEFLLEGRGSSDGGSKARTAPVKATRKMAANAAATLDAKPAVKNRRGSAPANKAAKATGPKAARKTRATGRTAEPAEA